MSTTADESGALAVGVTGYVDFAEVRPEHHAIDERLRNWSRWANGTLKATCAPMFRLYRSSARGREDEPGMIVVDKDDARRINHAVAWLPEQHRKALQWAYVRPVSPARACREMQLSYAGLSAMLHAARDLLVASGV